MSPQHKVAPNAVHGKGCTSEEGQTEDAQCPSGDVLVHLEQHSLAFIVKLQLFFWEVGSVSHPNAFLGDPVSSLPVPHLVWKQLIEVVFIAAIRLVRLC